MHVYAYNTLLILSFCADSLISCSVNSDSTTDKECSTGESTLTKSFEDQQNAIELCLFDIHDAVRNGDVSLVQKIVQSGFHDVNKKDDDSCTALHLACQYGKLDTVKLLVEQGKCDIECSCKMGMRPIHYAAKYHQSDVLEYLYSQNCDKNVIDNDGNSVLHLLDPSESNFDDCWSIVMANNPEHVNRLDIDDTTPLHQLVEWNCLELVVPLIEQGADVNLQNYVGNTALHLFCRHIDKKPRNVQCIRGLQHLLDRTNQSIRNNSGHTAPEALQEAGMPVVPLIVYSVLVVACIFLHAVP